MPRVGLPLAILVTVAIHSILSVLVLATTPSSHFESVSVLFAAAALLLPGLVGGYLTCAGPLLLGLGASVAILIVQCVLTFALLGTYSWSLFLLGFPGDMLQSLVLCILAVAAFHLRARVDPPGEAVGS